MVVQRGNIPANGPLSSPHKCLATTNLIESPQSGVRRRTGNVTRWRDADMVERWAASAWLVTEKTSAALWDLNDALQARWLGFEVGERILLSDIARAHELVEHPARAGCSYSVIGRGVMRKRRMCRLV